MALHQQRLISVGVINRSKRPVDVSLAAKGSEENTTDGPLPPSLGRLGKLIQLKSTLPLKVLINWEKYSMYTVQKLEREKMLPVWCCRLKQGKQGRSWKL